MKEEESQPLDKSTGTPMEAEGLYKPRMPARDSSEGTESNL